MNHDLVLAWGSWPMEDRFAPVPSENVADGNFSSCCRSFEFDRGGSKGYEDAG